MTWYQYVTVLLFLQDMFKEFTRPTKTGYSCGKCGKKTEYASNQTSVQRLPEVLMLQLHRFCIDEAVGPAQQASSATKVCLLGDANNAYSVV